MVQGLYVYVLPPPMCPAKEEKTLPPQQAPKQGRLITDQNLYAK